MQHLIVPKNQDPITLKRIEKLHPALRAEAAVIYNQVCLALEGNAICRFSHTLRTFAEQDALYAQGRKTPGKTVTNAKAGMSYHNYGFAVDICMIVDTNGDGKFDSASWETNRDFDGDGKADWREAVSIFKAYGWEWGGDWKYTDAPHFQKTMGLSINEMKTRYLTGKKDKDNYITL